MANTTNTATTAAPLPQEYTTAATVSPFPTPQQIPVPKMKIKRWDGKEDNEPLEDTTTSSTSQQDKVAAELNIKALTIDDTKTLTSLWYHQSLTSRRFEFLYLPNPN
ncbi:hypothetical protein CFP56_032827 [Quercus suber]|uniref:Uncharacterized protein n=1 Tax=Quercus suber TaxID=58331 RepID=A0AAW0LRR3_QUESU|nr:hypothetical protein CFP56_74941 [Quercus suber]